jgi:secondary thiamine-phosphate synthase enzyme
MRIEQHRLAIETRRQGLHDITGEIAAWVAAQRMERGLLTLFIRHSSASLLIQENAAPEAARDLEAFMGRLVPEGPGLYAHEEEGPDDMPAHIRAALTRTDLSIPVASGRLLLGTWQGIFLFEHRRRPHRRELILHLVGA